MKHKFHILVMTLAISTFGVMVALLFRSGSIASAYPPPPTVSGPSGTHKIFVPAMSAVHAPAFTTSLYMKSTDLTTSYNLGKSYGSAGTGGIVVLDYGQPYKSGSDYGVRIFDGLLSFRNTSTIKLATEEFMHGWWDGYYSSGGQSIAPSAQISVAVGTSNCGIAAANDGNPCTPGGDSFYAGHAQAWAQLVIDLRQFINAPPSYAAKITVLAADDIEPEFNYATTTKLWIDSYTSYFSAVSAPTIKLVNYGSCDSCPYTDPGGGGCPTCPQNFTETLGVGGQLSWSWVTVDMRYVVWGATLVYPLVENYRTDSIQAWQWHQLSVYNHDNFAVAIHYLGTLSQHGACVQNGCLAVLDNSPQGSWLQLWSAIDVDSKTRLDSTKDMLYSSDIQYQ